MLWAAQRHYDGGYASEFHYHLFYHFIYLLDGGGAIQIGERVIDFTEHGFYVTPRMQPHRYWAQDPSGMHTIEVKFDLVESEFSRAVDQLPSVIHDSDSVIRLLLEQIIWEGLHEERYYVRNISNKVEELLISLIRGRGGKTKQKPTNQTRMESSRNNRHLREAVAYIEENYAQPIDLEQLAGIACYNASYFCKLFRSEIGTSPIHFLVDTRIEKAKELLSVSDLSVSEIAFKVGFDSIHYFNRCFSSRVGISPGRFKKNYREDIFLRFEDADTVLKNIFVSH